MPGMAGSKSVSRLIGLSRIQIILVEELVEPGAGEARYGAGLLDAALGMVEQLVQVGLFHVGFESSPRQGAVCSCQF